MNLNHTHIEARKIWFAIFIVPLTLAFSEVYPDYTLSFIVLFPLAVAVSFFLYRLVAMGYITSEIWVIILLVSIAGDIILYLLGYSIMYFLYILLFIFMWTGLIVLLDRSFNYEWDFIIVFLSILSPSMVCITFHYLVTGRFSFLLSTIVVSYSLFFAVFSMLYLAKRHRMRKKIWRNILSILFYVMGYGAVLFGYFYFDLVNSILLVLILMFYSWKNIKGLIMNEKVSEGAESRAYKNAIYSWFFYFIFLIGESLK